MVWGIWKVMLHRVLMVQLSSYLIRTSIIQFDIIIIGTPIPMKIAERTKNSVMVLGSVGTGIQGLSIVSLNRWDKELDYSYCYSYLWVVLFQPYFIININSITIVMYAQIRNKLLCPIDFVNLNKYRL